ncbi:hypothetical protein SAMN05661080_04221 [Modestobacter sp. DSM 44400]|uniref:hypothetical protein n=1 Tax=Modestobacter sp. DSM 44400 TaxID=1550230 RepID=UPI0008987A9E|nr:hypothetical protein [Modestobacter sp. DSM 44400]SDY66789.1 hypothetical protein SAMN05661080_04221 [Modestobacter sp. DSM 44400]
MAASSFIVIPEHRVDFAFGVVPFFTLKREESLGTWVATLLHISCALASVGNALVFRQRRVGWHRNWWLLAGVLTVTSLDEVAALHEHFNGVRSVGDLSGPLYYAWMIPIVAIGLVFLVVQARFLRSLGRTGRNLVFTGIVFVSAAAGLEMVESAVVVVGESKSAIYDALTIVEELTETASVMAALVILLPHLVRVLGEPTISIAPHAARHDGERTAPTA